MVHKVTCITGRTDRERCYPFWHLGKQHHCVQVLRTRGYDVAAVALMDSSGGNAAALRQHLGCCFVLLPSDDNICQLCSRYPSEYTLRW